MELIFVYNANSGIKAAVIDYLHKIVHPSTYPCHLCALTHSNIGQKKVWKDFVKKSDIKMSFYHIDDFEKKYNLKKEYPVILKKENNNLNSFILKKEINKMDSIDKLIAAIKANINSK